MHTQTQRDTTKRHGRRETTKVIIEKRSNATANQERNVVKTGVVNKRTTL